MKITILLIKFLFIGALFIVSNNNLILTESDNREFFFNEYFNWLNGLYDKGVELTSYVVLSEWLPVNNNQTLDSKEIKLSDSPINKLYPIR